MKLHRYFIALLLAVSFNAFAEEAVTDGDPELETAKQKLLAARPGLPIISIRKSVLSGFYDVRLQGGMVLYVNEDATHMFAGDLYFLRPGQLINATEQARTVERKKLLDELDESEMVVFSPPKGKTKRTITVFTDIDCGYCRKLHAEVPELNKLGIAVRYLAYPRAGIGSESYNKAVSAWCADNPQVALTKAKAGKEIETMTCANPVASQLALGEQFGVTGTPSIVLEDGTVQGGYLPADQMAVRLGVN